MSTALVTARPAPRLLDQLRAAALQRYGRPEPGGRFADWARRYILFHNKRHPRELGTDCVRSFLEHVAQTEKDPLHCLEQAHQALKFLYDDFLHQPLGEVRLPEPPKLLDRLRYAIRVRHYSPRTEECYVEWATRFIRFHGLRHPSSMGAAEIEMFLTDLAVKGHVAASTQNQAFCALLFLYQAVLGIELPRLDALRARRPTRLPTVLSPAEVRQLLQAMCGGDGVFQLMARLLSSKVFPDRWLTRFALFRTDASGTGDEFARSRRRGRRAIRQGPVKSGKARQGHAIGVRGNGQVGAATPGNGRHLPAA